MAGLNIMNESDAIKMEDIFRKAYTEQMPLRGEVVIPVGDYGVRDDDNTILYQFLEMVFSYEIENENVTLFINPDDYGVTIYLVKDFNPYA